MQSQTRNSKALIFKFGFLQLPVRARCCGRAAVVPCHAGITASESGEILGEPFPLGHDPTAQSDFPTKELSSHSSLEKLLPPNSSPKSGLRQRGESPLLPHILPWHCHQPPAAPREIIVAGVENLPGRIWGCFLYAHFSVHTFWVFMLGWRGRIKQGVVGRS